MQTIHISFTRPRNPGYDILIASGLLARLGRELKLRFPGRHPFLISSPRVSSLYGAPLRASLKRSGMPLAGRHLVPDGEAHKTFKEFERALKALAAFGRGQSRRPLGLVLGGGVLGDLGGFACAAYKRGIPFVQVPSTLLSMVDSSVGGKLGIDFDTPQGRIKNLVGAFYQPSLVLVDPSLLKTLPARELRAGLAEVVKTAMLFDPELFAALEGSVDRLLAADPVAYSHIIQACAEQKAQVVMEDEYDTGGRRALLNLGHTFGHAVESASGFKLLHGEAVAFGLACACDLALALKVAPRTRSAELARVEALLGRLGLATRFRGVPLAKAMAAMGQDKKFEGGARFVLPQRLGQAVLVKQATLKAARAVLASRFGRPSQP